MTTSYTDARHKFYKDNTDGINRYWAKNERIFLLQFLGLTASSKHNHGLFKDLFNDLGYSGSLSDMWYAYLEDQGYDGSLRERQRDFWLTGGFGFLSQFSGVAGGWSLRKLAASSTDVVRVRRSSDDAEQSFDQNEVQGTGMIDWVNGVTETLPLNTNDTASLALSLRNLKDDFNGAVVRVRRDSDNAEANFNATEVTDDTLTDWVTEELDQTQTITDRDADWEFWFATTGDATNIVTATPLSLNLSGTVSGYNVKKPAGIDLNADEGSQIRITYSASNIDAGGQFVGKGSGGGGPSTTNSASLTNGTNNVALITSVNSTTNNFTFGISGTNCSVTVHSVEVIGQDGSVTTWYDQRVSTENDRTYFTGSSNEYIALDSSINFTGAFDFAFKIVPTDFSTTSGAFQRIFRSSSGNTGGSVAIISNGEVGLYYGASTYFNYNSPKLILNQENTVVVSRDSSDDVSITINGVTSPTVENIPGTWNIAQIGGLSSGNLLGSVYDITLTDDSTLVSSYNGYGNQSENWEDQTGTNDGTINGSPRRLNFSDFTIISNDAIQDTVANQPKLVEAGVVNTVNGNPAIDFDGSDDYLEFPTISGVDGSSFAVLNRVAATRQIVIGADDASVNYALYWFTDNRIYSSFGDTGFYQGVVNTSTGQSVITSIESSNVTNTFENGEDQATTPAASPSGDYDFKYIGRRVSQYFSGELQEVILYTTAVTSDRPEIEGNMYSHYSITPTINGNVTTWYDQTVPTSKDYIKFVSSGDYISIPDSADFDVGSNDFKVRFKFYIDSDTQVEIFTKYDAGSDESFRIFRRSTTGRVTLSTTSDGLTDDSVDFAASVGLFPGTLYDVEVSKSGTNATLTVNGTSQTLGGASATVHSGSTPVNINARAGIGVASGVVISDVEFENNGVVVASWEGRGNTNEDWVDTIGSNNGTINGSPKRVIPVSDYNDKMYFAGTSEGTLVKLDSEISLTGAFDITFKTVPNDFSTDPGFRRFFGGSSNDIFIDTGEVGIRFGGTNYRDFNDVLLLLNQENTIQVSRDGSNVITVTINGVTSSQTETYSGTWTISTIGATDSDTSVLKGTIYDINIDNQASYIGDGISDTNWEDQIGSNDGTVNGSPRLVQEWDFPRVANDLTQSTAANQPTIVEDGVVVTNEAGNTTINFIKDQDVLSATTGVSVNMRHIFSVFEYYTEGNANNFNQIFGGNYGINKPGFVVDVRNAGNKQVSFDGNVAAKGKYAVDGGSLSATFEENFLGVSDVPIDQTLLMEGLYENIENITDIFIADGQAPPSGGAIYLSEIIVFDADKSTERSDINTNINNYWSIY